MYKSPIFCVPKKTGQGLHSVQDFREPNEHSHIDKYSVKEINNCIGNIGRANSTIFSTWISHQVSGKGCYTPTMHTRQLLQFQVKANLNGSPVQWDY